MSQLYKTCTYVYIYIYIYTLQDFLATSWNMISEKCGTLHFHLAWTGETLSIKIHTSWVHQTHRTLRTVITYNALVSSLATPNQPRWRWVLMYLEDMQVASQYIACRWYAAWIWMECTHEDLSIWRTRWIQAYCFMPAQVKRIATDIITFNAAMSACENEDELVQGMAVCWHFSCNAEVCLAPLRPTGWGSMTGVGACFGFDFLLGGLLQFHVDKECSCVADVEPHVWDVSRRSGCKRISSALILASAPVHPVPWLRNLPLLRDSTPSTTFHAFTVYTVKVFANTAPR